jgi:hypothetical protein
MKLANEVLSIINEGDVNPYHKILTQHGFNHKSSHDVKHKISDNNFTSHKYEHPEHGKSHVEVW